MVEKYTKMVIGNYLVLIVRGNGQRKENRVSKGKKKSKMKSNIKLNDIYQRYSNKNHYKQNLLKIGDSGEQLTYVAIDNLKLLDNREVEEELAKKELILDCDAIVYMFINEKYLNLKNLVISLLLVNGTVHLYQNKEQFVFTLIFTLGTLLLSYTILFKF